jgi:hypothetical protein
MYEIALFLQEIEKEFTHLYLENAKLKEQIQHMEKGLGNASERDKGEEDTDGFDINVIKSFTKKNFPKTRHKLKVCNLLHISFLCFIFLK